jgi:hypothetical protein
MIIEFTPCISVEGKILNSPKRIANKKNMLLANISLVSDDAGSLLVALEPHTSSGNIPIQIEIQILTSK